MSKGQNTAVYSKQSLCFVFASISTLIIQCSHHQQPLSPPRSKAVYMSNHIGCEPGPTFSTQALGLEALGVLKGDLASHNKKSVDMDIASTNRLLLGARIAKRSRFHTVRRGETLSSIAARYKLGVKHLSQENGVNPHKLRTRQILKIPMSLKSELQTSLELASIWDHQFANELAKQALAYGSIGLSKGHCLQGVRIALTRSLQTMGLLRKNTRLHMGRSAHSFRTWALNNARQLCEQYRLVAIEPETSVLNLPGLIYVYGKGRCGFSKKHGHVETVVSSKPTLLCSDNCRYGERQNCRPDLILAPCKTCPKTSKSFKAPAENTKTRAKPKRIARRQTKSNIPTI